MIDMSAQTIAFLFDIGWTLLIIIVGLIFFFKTLPKNTSNGSYSSRNYDSSDSSSDYEYGDDYEDY